MTNYNEAKIYILKSTKTQNVYIGSTCCSLKKRLTEHRSDLGSYLKDKKNYRTSFEIVKYDDCTIEILEEFPCTTKEELALREGFHIKNNENSINICVAGRSRKEYYYDNHQKLLQQKREYYHENHEKICKRRRDLYKIKKNNIVSLVNNKNEVNISISQPA